jgi:hypothetical protein
MFTPKAEPELAELPLWIRPPSAKWIRNNDRKRPMEFAMKIAELSFLSGLKLFDPDDEDEELLEEAIGFRRAGRQGLYVAYLLYLGLKRNAFACFLLAGIIAQIVKEEHPDTVRRRRQLHRRAVGWLAAIRPKDFNEDFGFDPAKLTRFRTALQDEVSDRDRSSTRRLALNEGKIAVIKDPIRKFRSDTTNSDRYKDLHEPLPLAGNLDAQRAADLLRALREEYPWANDLLTDIDTAVTLSVSSGRRWLSFPPILIVGPPGIGKTRLVRRLSALSGVPYEVVNGAGASDNRSFAGTARGWGSAHPSRIVEVFIDTQVANPIVLVDELEKAGGSEKNGQITQSLLTMLEPETNRQFYDEALATSVDLSFVNWVFTANSLKDLGRPLLSRLRIVHMPVPPPSFAPKFLKSALRELCERYGWTEDMLPTFDPVVTSALKASMAKGASPRTLVAMLEQILAIEVKRRRSLLN